MAPDNGIQLIDLHRYMQKYVPAEAFRKPAHAIDRRHLFLAPAIQTCTTCTPVLTRLLEFLICVMDIRSGVT